MAAIAIGLDSSLLPALTRMSSNKFVREPARSYTLVMRATPVPVQSIVIYTGLPHVGLRLGVLTSAIIGLGLNESAYLAQIFCAGTMTVPRGQFEAGQALGRWHGKTMWPVVVQQAPRVAVRLIGNTFNGLMRTSSLASGISMDELPRRTEMLMQTQFRVLKIFDDTALYYLLMMSVLGLIQRWIEQRLGRAETRAMRTAFLGGGAQNYDFVR